jgi:hypothetical protein
MVVYSALKTAGGIFFSIALPVAAQGMALSCRLKGKFSYHDYKNGMRRFEYDLTSTGQGVRQDRPKREAALHPTCGCISRL